MDLPPPTRYARRGGLSIAYQLLGRGPPTIAWVLDWPSHLDLMWLDADIAGFFRRMASFAQVLLMDRPGSGLSDPVDHVPTLEDQANDLRAVLDDAGIARATVCCATTSTSGVALFAAREPERIDGLMLAGPWARGPAAAPEDRLVGWEGKAAELLADATNVLEHWGDGLSLPWIYPGLASARLLRAWAMLERASASPAMAYALVRAALEADTTEILPSIRAHTLVLLHADSPIPQGVSRHVAELIPNAEFHRLPPSSAATGLADFLSPAADHIERLVTGRSPSHGRDRNRILASVLFTDIVGSTQLAAELGDTEWAALLDRHQRSVRDHVENAGGRVVDLVGDGSLSAFDGPARAIHCAQGLCEAAPQLGVEVRAGLHTGECERVGDDLAGLAVHIGARVAAAAGPGEIWLSRTVRDLVAGSGIEFRGRGTHELKGVPGAWELFSVADARSEPIAVTREGPRLKIADRIVLTAARRAPRFTRAATRLGDRSQRSPVR